MDRQTAIYFGRKTDSLFQPAEEKQFTVQHTNDLRNRSKSTKVQRQNKIDVSERPSQSSELKPMKYKWKDLKGVHRRSFHYLVTLKYFFHKLWNKISKLRCVRLVGSYRKEL